MMAVVQTELDRVMRRGRRVFQPSFVLYYLPLSRKLSPRIVVSQKVDKRSVVRHKVKRRIRHILKHLDTRNYGVVIITNKTILTQSFPDLSHSLRSVINRLP